MKRETLTLDGIKVPANDYIRIRQLAHLCFMQTNPMWTTNRAKRWAAKYARDLFAKIKHDAGEL